VSASKFFTNYFYRVRDSRPAQLDPTELINEATGVLLGTNREQRSTTPEAAVRIPNRVTLIVDDIHEFSASQWRFIEAWSRSRGKIIVLGDPDLRIVGFKGTAQVLLDNSPTGPVAEWKQTIHFPEIHRQAGVMPTVLGQIVGATRSAGNTQTRSSYPATKEIDFAELRKAAGFELKTGLAVSAQGERQLISQYLRSVIGGGVPAEACAVLVRNGAAAETIVEHLASASLPAFTETTGSPLRDHPAVWSLLTIVTVGTGLSELNADIASRLLHGPFGGVTSIEYRRFRRALRKLEITSGGRRFADELMLEALLVPGSLEGPGYDIPKSVKWMSRTLSKLRESNETSVDELLWEVWNSSKKAEEWAAVSALGGADAAWANDSLDAVLALFGVAANALENDPGETVDTFMHRVLGQTVPNDSLTPRFTSGAIFVGTPTSAAGMEFDTVVVAGLNEGVWPNTRARSSLLSANRLADAVSDALEKIPEDQSPARQTAIIERYKSDHAEVLRDEIRLFLIAMSRAKRATLVTAIISEEESPSALFRLIAGEKEEDEKTARNEPAANSFAGVFDTADTVGSLPQLVGSLRGELLSENSNPEAKTRAALLLNELARRGIRGSDPSDWLGMQMGTPQPLFQNTDILLSPSALETFAESPLDWFVSAVAGGESGIHASVGNLVHSSLQTHPAGTFTEIENAVLENWDGLGLDVPWINQMWRNKVNGILTGMVNYLRRSEAAGRTHLYVEKKIEMDLPIPGSKHKVLLSGRVDRIEQTDSGEIVIIDFKTGKTPQGITKNISENLQLKSYQLAFQLGKIDQVDSGSNKLQHASLVYSRPQIKDTYTEYVQAGFSEAELLEFEQYLLAVAEEMNSAAFTGPAETKDNFGGGVDLKKQLFRTPEVSSDE
jgi:superfamily I DNA/RNA helicase